MEKKERLKERVKSVIDKLESCLDILREIVEYESTSDEDIVYSIDVSIDYITNALTALEEIINSDEEELSYDDK